MWISVKDRLPEYGKVVDVWYAECGRIADCYLHCVRRNSDGQPEYGVWNHKRDGTCAGGPAITHWMERPAPQTDEDVTSRS